LSFKENSPKDLESLVKSSRIFEELELPKGCGDHLLLPAKFEELEKYLGFTGPHIKKLITKDIRVDPGVMQKFLNLLPNLKSLELDRVKVASHQSVKWDLKSTKIERLKIRECTGLEKLPESLEKFAIEEMELRFSQKNKNVSWEFLEHQSDLKLFRLEHKNLPNGILKMIRIFGICPCEFLLLSVIFIMIILHFFFKLWHLNTCFIEIDQFLLYFYYLT
jgi:hypothetical protein